MRAYILAGTILAACFAGDSRVFCDEPASRFAARPPSLWETPGLISPASNEASGVMQAAYERESQPRRLAASFDDGFKVATDDEEFELRIRAMQQTDAKLFLPTNQEPARPGLYIPRFRAYFEGHVTSSYEYELSLQRSVEGSFDVLDASLNYRPSEDYQVRFGRFIVPFSYDWFDHLEQFFITPERALFPLNFGLSREAGVMLWGEPHEGALQYAVGGFSGQLSGLADTNTTRDAVAYLNWRPFREDHDSALQFLNIGGSGSLGQQAYAADPLPLRTSIQASENDEAASAASSVFLEFEDDVQLLGGRSSGALHLAWYYRQLSLESEVQVGRFQYQTPTQRPNVDVYGYHVGVSYFVTGEEVTGRGGVVPHNRFDPAAGCFGSGAIEPFVRFSHLTLDDAVFAAGLADPDDWTRRVSMIDVGWNWYPNRYVKLYFDWQMAFYDTPVLIDSATSEHEDQNHTIWARTQISF